MQANKVTAHFLQQFGTVVADKYVFTLSYNGDTRLSEIQIVLIGEQGTSVQTTILATHDTLDVIIETTGVEYRNKYGLTHKTEQAVLRVIDNAVNIYYMLLQSVDVQLTLLPYCEHNSFRMFISELFGLVDETTEHVNINYYEKDMYIKLHKKDINTLVYNPMRNTVSVYIGAVMENVYTGTYSEGILISMRKG